MCSRAVAGENLVDAGGGGGGQEKAQLAVVVHPPAQLQPAARPPALLEGVLHLGQPVPQELPRRPGVRVAHPAAVRGPPLLLPGPRCC